MILCDMCAKTCTDMLTHVRHMRTHSCTPNASFKFVFPGCHRTFQKFRTFKSHSYHHCRGQSRSTLYGFVDLTCHVGLCSTKCDNTQNFFSHLKVHIREGKEVACPFRKSSCVFFITEQYQAVRLPEFGVYYITQLKTEYCCVAHENLLDYYPLTEYTVWGMSLPILHHSIPTF